MVVVVVDWEMSTRKLEKSGGKDAILFYLSIPVGI